MLRPYLTLGGFVFGWIARADNGFGFDFDEVLGSNEFCFDEGVCGSDIGKAFAVDAGDGFPVFDVADVDPGANDVSESATLAIGALQDKSRPSALETRLCPLTPVVSMGCQAIVCPTAAVSQEAYPSSRAFRSSTALPGS